MKRPLFLIHGLWDNPYVFNRLIGKLDTSSNRIFTPFIPHRLGKKSLKYLAKDLDKYILKTAGSNAEIDLLGFSMGGLIARIWLQQMGGYKRTIRFFSIGTPHQGTFTAQVVPACLFPGIAQMKKGSFLLSELNSDLSMFKAVSCISYFCKWDLMVFPGNQAVLPIGVIKSIPVFTHKALIKDPVSLQILSMDLIQDLSLGQNDELMLL